MPPPVSRRSAGSRTESPASRRFCSSGGRPGPPSSTSTATSASLQRMLTCTVSKPGEWRTALSIKLVSARSIRCRSPCNSTAPGGWPASLTRPAGINRPNFCTASATNSSRRKRSLCSTCSIDCKVASSNSCWVRRRSLSLCASAVSTCWAACSGLPAPARKASKWPCKAVNGVRRSCATLAMTSRCAAAWRCCWSCCSARRWDMA